MPAGPRNIIKEWRGWTRSSVLLPEPLWSSLEWRRQRRTSILPHWGSHMQLQGRREPGKWKCFMIFSLKNQHQGSQNIAFHDFDLRCNQIFPSQIWAHPLSVGMEQPYNVGLHESYTIVRAGMTGIVENWSECEGTIGIQISIVCQSLAKTYTFCRHQSTKNTNQTNSNIPLRNNNKIDRDADLPQTDRGALRWQGSNIFKLKICLNLLAFTWIL